MFSSTYFAFKARITHASRSALHFYTPGCLTSLPQEVYVSYSITGVNSAGYSIRIIVFRAVELGLGEILEIMHLQ